MGYVCIGETEGGISLVSFEDSGTCETLSDTIEAKCKLSDFDIRNFFKEEKLSFIGVSEFTRKEAYGSSYVYTKVLRVSGTYDYIDFCIEKIDEKTNLHLKPDEDKDDSFCRIYTMHKSKFGDIVSCNIFVNDELLNTNHVIYKSSKARYVNFRFDDKDYDRYEYKDEKGNITICNTPKFVSEIDYNATATVNKNRYVEFGIDFVNKDGSIENNIKVKVTLGYDDFIYGLEIDELRLSGVKLKRENYL